MSRNIPVSPGVYALGLIHMNDTEMIVLYIIEVVNLLP